MEISPGAIAAPVGMTNPRIFSAAYNCRMSLLTGNVNVGRTALLAALNGAGFPPATLRAPGLGELVVLPHAGRVIGLFAGESDKNLLWINPALGQANTAREALTADHWVHLGGDRTWVGPERELFVGDLDNPWETYIVPAELDPGHYTLAQMPTQISWRSPARLDFHHTQRSSEVEIEKSVRLIADPLRLEADRGSMAGVDYAGYELTTSLRLVDPAVAGPPVGLWNILVVEGDGWTIVPVAGETHVRDFFVPTPPERLLSTAHAVGFRLDGREQHKIAVRAAALTGRAGYLRRDDAEHSTLLVRSFVVNPSGEYVDTPWDAPNELGYAFQSYNDDGKLGGAFGELEYHTPAIGGNTGLDQYTDVSQLWAYTGPTASIDRIAAQLLGADSLAVVAGH
jgi:hypothetical protein